MSSIGTLYTVPAQYIGYAYLQAVASFAGLQVKVDDDYDHFVTNKTPEFLAKFPHGKIPAFEGTDGFLVFESSAIALYIASLAPKSSLLGTSKEELGEIHQWLSFATNEIHVYSQIINQLLEGILTPYHKSLHSSLAERQQRSFRTLNQHLSTRTFLVGERISLADIYMATVLKRAFETTYDAPLCKELFHTVRFYETIVNQPSMKKYFGTTEYVQKAKHFVPPAKRT